MNVPTPVAVEQALTDVRKAYRLLYIYQRAALDAIRYVGDQLGLTYTEGIANFTEGPPKGGRGALSRSAWSWLSLVFYDFTFGFEIEQAEDQRSGLAIWLFSDTGFYLTDDSVSDKAAVGAFAPAEESGTKLAILLFPRWDGGYGRLFTDDKRAIRHFLQTSGELPTALTNGGVVATCYDFARLADEKSTDILIDEIVDFAKKHGFSLRRKAKAE